MAISEKMKEQVKFFDQNYISSFYHMNKSNKTYLGTKDNQICRFCGKRNPKVTFKKDAHAIPELVGNRYLLSHYECDSCNGLFARTVEDHFSKYTLPERNICQIYGKRGIPSFKSNDGKSRIDMKDNGLNISTPMDSNFIDFDGINNKLPINYTRPPYVPRFVYKCFVKMALSLLPENEVPNFKDALNWIQIENPNDDPIKDTKMFQIIKSFTPGPHPYRWPTAIYFIRKNDNIELPYSLFYLAFSNLAFLTHIYCPSKDSHLQNRSIKVQSFPGLFPEGNEFGKTQYEIVDLSSNEVISNEKHTLTLSYERAERIK